MASACVRIRPTCSTRRSQTTRYRWRSLSGKVNENYFSAATLVAYLGKPNFNSFITYTAANDGDPKSGTEPSGVEVLLPAWGIRTVLCFIRTVTCTELITGQTEVLVRWRLAAVQVNKLQTKKCLRRAQPNHKRAEDDPKRCKWNGPGHTKPLMVPQSSTGGIIEFASDHFSGQIRGNLIYAKYWAEIYCIVLDPSGNPAAVIMAPIPTGGNNT